MESALTDENRAGLSPPILAIKVSFQNLTIQSKKSLEQIYMLDSGHELEVLGLNSECLDVSKSYQNSGYL